MRKFVRTRRSSPEPVAPSLALHHAPCKTNGHANGGTGGTPRDDYHSTLSSARWSGSERRRRAEGAEGAEGAGALWEDAEFPATWRALGDRKFSDVAWLRPHELCAAPRFRGDGARAAPEPEPEPPDRFAARWRVEVGAAGVPALCAAAGALALTPRLLSRVAPHQAFHHRYTGAFTFRLWVWGAWREVVVDDRLPARGRPRRLLASRAALPDDFTLPLLEKAYAKLHGSYREARARGGGVAGALRALTGGVVQAVPLSAPAPAPLLHSALPRATLLLAETHQETGAAWVVTGLARVRHGGAGRGGADEALVRVRAVGALPPGAPTPRVWAALPAADRDVLAQRAHHPGEIWLSLGELAGAFRRLALAHLGPDEWLLEPALAARRPWRAVLARRRWRPHYNAGGPPHADTTGANPQFQLEIGASGGGAEGPGEEEVARCHVVVSVLQQYAPGGGGGGGGGAAGRAVGAAVYALGEERARAGELPARARALDVTHTARATEVVSFFTLPAGRYLVVPHGHPAAFLLRLYTDAHASVWEVNDDNLLLRNIADEPEEAEEAGAPPLPRAMRAALDKILGAKHDDELEVEEVWAVLRADWRWCLRAPPSRDLARALTACGDAHLHARLPAARLPSRCRLLRAWREAWRREAGGACARGAPALRLRSLLRACGAGASNKVVEALCVRHAPDGRLQLEPFLRAMLVLHLAHDRYRRLDTKLKANPLSLEEMILMTIYS